MNTALQHILKENLGFRWGKGDWDAFLTLGTNNLANIVILPAILMNTFHFPGEIVFGRILPGLCLTLLVGMAWFGLLAKRLAKREGRQDVAALPYGISTPVMFVFLFGIMGPVYFATSDALLAYRIGLGAAFIGGLIEMCGALIGPWLERITPRAGMLGTIAGVSIIWIAMVPSAIIFENPIIGLPALFVILLGLVGMYRFPFRLPAGLVAIGLGIVLGLVTGQSSIQFENVGFYLPIPVLGDLIAGVSLLFQRPEILAVVIPIEIYNFIETSGNVSSAKAAGDSYDTRECQLIDGFGTVLGAAFGSPFPTTVHIGHPAYKQMGAQTGYLWVSGAFLFGASMIGMFAFLQHLIPAAAVAPLLVYVGIVITNYAFRAAPPAHGVAIAFALIPHIADLLKKQLDGTIFEVLRQNAAPELMNRLASNQGVYLESYSLLSHGAILTGLLWGAMLAFLIDRNLRQAILFSGMAFILSLFGVIHAEQLGLNLSPITSGYLVLTGLFTLFHLHELRFRIVVETESTDSIEQRLT
jgi:AGZA family xanthine/uracil permease-like MFS transporter